MAPNRTHRPNSARPRIPQKSGPVTTRTSKDGPEITLRQTADALARAILGIEDGTRQRVRGNGQRVYAGRRECEFPGSPNQQRL